MIKISKKSQYGLRAMVCLAKNYKDKKICSTKIISEQEGIPFDFLEKIVSQLEKARLVKGLRGAQGGYVLSKNPGRISAKDVVFVLEGKDAAVDCSLCGRAKKCLTKNVWRKIENSLNKTLQSITLAELIK